MNFLNANPLSYAHILAVANVWRDIGGSREIAIGSLEPLLWRDGQYRIYDVVNTLTESGFKVSMTTNGQLLDTFAEKLARAGLSHMRISWHSIDPLAFRDISGGYGDYNRFMRGVAIALESGIKVTFNRILFKGYTNDISEQLSFIERHKSRLKLYTLWWTPQSASSHQSFYQNWHSVVRASVLPRTIRITRMKKRIGRNRLQFHLTKGGLVEVKLGDKLDRSLNPCASCSFKNECKEGFGEYIRVDPRLNLYFCYLRRDLGFRIKDSARLRQGIQDTFGDVKRLLAGSSLVLTVTPFCNFNCTIPGTQKGYCLEEPGEYIYKTRTLFLRANQP